MSSAMWIISLGLMFMQNLDSSLVGGGAGIDISVLTRDLDRSTLEKPGMGELIKNTIGVSIDHMKKSSSCKEWSQYRYIRQFGWEKEKICEEKIVYAAMDASLSLVIVFNYVREYERQRGTVC